MFKPLMRLSLLLATTAALALIPGCKKKPSAATDDDAAGASATTESAQQPQAKDIAARMGFATKLPASTEAYFGALNLPAHLAELKKSSWAKEVNAFLEDKVPAPSATSQASLPNAQAATAQLWGHDFFFAVGKGGAKALAPWREVMSIQSELSTLAAMQGNMSLVTAAVNPGEKKDDSTAKKDPAKDSAAMLESLTLLLSQPELLKRCVDVIAHLELPPLMMGIQTDKADDVLRQIVPADLLEIWKKKARVSQVTMRGDGKFTLVEGTLATFLTDDLKNALVAGLPASTTDIKGPVIAALEAMQKKPFSLAFGSTAGHVIIAVGSARPDLEFVADPAKSLFARPELAFVQPFAARNLIAIMFAQGETLQALEQTDSLQAGARGVLAGLKTSPLFGKMAEALEPKIKALADAERDLHSRKPTTMTGIAWWDKGLHMETKGGQSPEGLKADTPLKFAPLLDDASVVAAISYHGDPEMTARIRTLVEGWAGVVNSAAHELVTAGLGGKDGGEIAKWVDKDVVPPVVDFYQGSKALFKDGTGNEHAWVIDLGGKLPPLPFFPQKAGETPPKMLRIAALDDVTNRGKIAENWDKMQSALNKIAAAFPLLAGQKLPEPDIRNQNGGITTYSYPLLPDVDDLVPCASISSQMLMIGSSSNQHGDLSTRLLKARPATVPNVAQWRINFPAIRDAVKTFSTTGAQATNADQMKSTVKWLSPLGNATGRMWIEAGNVRNSVTIDVKDVLQFD